MEARRPEITQQLMTAASEIGFFRVKGEIWQCVLVLADCCIPEHRSAGGYGSKQQP